MNSNNDVPAVLAQPEGEGPSEEGIAEMVEDLEWRRLPLAEGTGNSFFLDLALTALARWGYPTTPPSPEVEPETLAEALAARPLLEKVVRLGDCIGQQTVAQVRQLAEQASAWLRDNPPGQPVAIEPRGCPTPGACSCVEPTPPAPEADLAAKLISESKPMDPEMAEALTPEARRDLYSGPTTPKPPIKPQPHGGRQIDPLL